MSYQQLLTKRLEKDGPIRAGLIGAGKFGSMFLSQVPSSRGIEVSVIADLNPDGAKAACRSVGWTDEQIAAVRFVDDGEALIASDDVEVVLEVTGHPAAGVRHARSAFEHGKHIIMVNVEADVMVGPLLAEEAASAGVVYSMAYGDQPALTCELIDWARSTGFDVVTAGKGTRYQPQFHSSTPDTVWDYYGLTPEQAAAAGMNSQMFNSFLDGTKSGLEMAAICNASGLTPAPDGLMFPACGTDHLAHVLKPASAGGILHHKGQVEVIASEERDGRPTHKDLRWGVYVVIEAPNDYAASCFAQYGLAVDETGRYASMYKPWHLIGLELNISVLSAVLRGEATGATDDWRGDVVATAKRDLQPGETLDGEGGFTVWGKLMPASDSLAMGGLPIGLAHDVRLKNAIPVGKPVTWADIDVPASSEAFDTRKKMEREYAARWKIAAA